MSIPVTLTQPEAYTGAWVGLMRNLCSIFDGRRTEFSNDKTWHIHAEGGCGEMAVCKALNIHNPLTVNNFNGPDIGSNIQVRTRSSHNYDLIVRRDDKDEDVFVLVTGQCPQYQVRGWMMAKEAKQDKYLANHGGYGEAWFVPAKDLKDINELPEECK